LRRARLEVASKPWSRMGIEMPVSVSEWHRTF
jgi:hypothetical protein